MACSSTSSAGDLHRLSEVRIVLLGCRDAGKSSSGNTILGEEKFEFNQTSQCVKRQGHVTERQITVVEAPGWQRDNAVEQLLKQEIQTSVTMCPPGPHAVLLVIRLDFEFTERERRALVRYVGLLGPTVWRHTIVLFTFGDSLGDTTIERHIESEGQTLQCLVEKCGNRYHVFNNKKRDDVSQVSELLEKIEKMVAGNSGCHLEIDREILQNVEQKKAEEKRSTERLMKVSKKREDIRKHMSVIHHLPEVRIVLLGYSNAGKSSSGNTILGEEKFEFNQTSQCVKRQGNATERKITVVEAPGWQRDKAVEQFLKQEIQTSVSLCPPGPHAVLLVIRLDFAFREKERNALVEYVGLLGWTVWNHTIVLFTFGDSLGDTTIERHIESEGQTLQWLVEKCGNKYHVFNNKKRDDVSQVSELMEKIEEMVAGKGCLLKTSENTVISQYLQQNTGRRAKKAQSEGGKLFIPSPSSRLEGELENIM
ncbi:GTPase IMAP family member 8-like [Tachysurus vachellii]|uniref:GTPase IMAP family member 8-like n=1 Tax=Tachysurus vachellii TaxID=175792 RepID=UPI00296B2395|nr:GTPase IMAP family member 8-like [Tachysurus vachellii]